VKDFQVATRIEDDALVIALRGELDIATIPAFHRALTAVRATDTERVVIDTSELDFIGIAGVRALVAEAGALKHSKCSVRTINMQPRVHQALRLLHAEAQLGASHRRD
jgi:anti-anti-sigma factor